MPELSHEMFQPYTLTEAINRIHTPQLLLVDLLFSRRELSDSDTIVLERRDAAKKLTAAVAKASRGVADADGRASAQAVMLPRFRKYYTLTPSEARKIRSLEEARTDQWVQANIQQLIPARQQQLRMQIERRWEQMAAQAVTGGKITAVAGDEVDFAINFGFAPAQMPTLAGAALWSAANSDPLKNIREWKRAVGQRYGFAADTAVGGSAAIDAFLANDKVLKYLHNNAFQAGRLDANSSTNTAFVGRFGGVDVYEHAQQFESGGNDTGMFPEDRFVVTSRQGDAMRLHFGLPYDFDAAQPTPFFSKIVQTPNPSTIEIIAESVSAPIIWDAGSVVSAKVV
jgi:hypothetical protein